MTMLPVSSSSNHRPGIVQLPQLKDGSVGTKLGSFLAAPPLYYNSTDASSNHHHRSDGGISGSGSSGSTTKQRRVLLVTDRNGNRINLPPKSPSSFTPIKDDKPASTTTTSYLMSSSTPPVSPYHHSKIMISSPSPTLMSVTTATSETTNETSLLASPYCMSPVPSYTNSYMMCYPGSDSPSSVRYNSNNDILPPSTPTSTSSSRRGSGLSSFRSPGGYASPLSSPSSSSNHHHRLSYSSPIKSKNLLTSFGSPASSSNTTMTEDTANRKQRIKTELCTHYKRGKVCPFGARCTYAHGEEELQMTKLMDWHRAGLIEDIETYRTKPCLTWVTTGACPFGVRCPCIHDLRVAGSHPSWLPHTETQGNSLNTDINVDAMHQKRMHAILYDNPFGDQFTFELDDWADLYKLVCNVTSNIRRRRSSHLTELQKLSIVLQMRGSPGWMYKYRPQHIVYDTLCMVMQKQAFKVDQKSGNAIPIKLSHFNANNPKHVLVREIAFGPDSDPACRPVSLWFNIPEASVTECTAQQAKKFRWKKKPKGVVDHEQRSMGSPMFESQDNFAMIRPEDRDAFELATKILQHRYATLKADALPNLKDRSVALKEADEFKSKLQEEFKYQRRHWLEWAWPINNGAHQVVNEDTPVPSVNSEYVPVVIDDEADIDDPLMMDSTKTKVREAVQGHYVQRIWESFVSFRLEDEETSPLSSSKTKKRGGSSSPEDKIINNRQQTAFPRRLSVFARLGYGEPVSEDRTLPHIRSKIIPKKKKNESSSPPSKPLKYIENTVHRQSERCWKTLMLQQDDDELQKINEWQEVLSNFQKARSKNSLKQVQQ